MKLITSLLIAFLLVGCTNTSKYRVNKAVESPEAAFALGNQLYAQGDRRKGLEWIKSAADRNYKDAQYAAGLLLASGQFGNDRDEEAEQYLALASESGMHQASFRLAEYYRMGIIGEPNLSKAVEYYELAIYQGSMDARKALGVMYLKGIGVQSNKSKANELLSVFN